MGDGSTLNANARRSSNNWANGFVYNFENFVGGSGQDYVVGSNADQTNGGNNSIFADAGNDSVRGGTGNDTMDGGDGSDVLDYSYVTANLSVNLSPVTDGQGRPRMNSLSVSTNDIDFFWNFEGLIAGSGNDTLLGGSQTLGGYFDGGAGNDSIVGGAGADTLRGGLGNDTLDGGTGGNMVDYGYLQAGQTLTFTSSKTSLTAATVGQGTSSVTLGESDTLNNIQSISLGIASINLNADFSTMTVNVTVINGSGNSSVVTGSGSDSISVGYGGNNTFDGGAGYDWLNLAGVGGGIYGIETVIMTGQSGVMTGFNSVPPYAANNSTVNFSNFEYITLTNWNAGGIGTGVGDKFIGSFSSSNIYIYAWGGADTLDDGGGSNMTLEGQTDNDIYFIRSATTQVNDGYYGSTYGNVNSINTTLTSLDLSSSRYGGGGTMSNLTYLNTSTSNYNSATGTWNTTALGSGNFTGIGNDLDNVITSGSGNDSLVGGAGADTLIGNGGNDYLRGGDRATGTDSTNRFSSTNGVSGLMNAASTGGISTAPDGTTSAFLLSNSANSGMHYGQFNLGSSSVPMIGAGRYTGTIFARKAASNAASHIIVAADGNTNGTWIAINLDKMTSGNTVSANGVVYAGNLPSGETFSVTYDALTGWYQISLTYTATTNGTGINFRVYLLDQAYNPSNPWNSTTASWDGTGKTPLGVLLWGNSLVAADGADSLNGGAGNDTLQGGAGNDTMDGGSDFDIADYSYLTTNATFDMAKLGSANLTQMSVGVGDVDSVANFEGVIAGSGNDSLLGNAAANYLSGGLGSDTIQGGLGNDTIEGGGGYGLDVADYSYFNNDLTITLNGSTGPLIVNLGSGDVDTLYNIEGIIAGNGANSLTGDSLANWFRGGTGNGTIRGMAGNDTIDGGRGADSLDGGADNDMLSFASAITTGVSVSLATSVVTGGGYTGTSFTNFEGVIGSSFSDTIIGTSGAETFDGGASTSGDNINGGGGNDWLSYASLVGGLGVSVQLGNYLTATTLITGGAGNDTVQGNFVGVIGSQYSDSLRGSAANETFDGGAGNASDTIDGNGGIDWLSFASLNRGQGVNLTLSDTAWTTAALSTGGAGTKLISGTFRGIIGSAFADSFVGSTSADTIFGGAGNDTIDGWRGADSLDGGAGFDLLTFVNASAGVNVSLASSSMNGGGYSATYSNFEGIIGSGFADTFSGDNSSNYLYGMAGADSLFGGDGADTLQGGTGNDTIDGGAVTSGVDLADYTYTNSALNITLNGATGVGSSFNVNVGTGDADTVRNVEGILSGGGADSITGDSLANYIDGGAGNDTLVGGGGADSLFGGAGNDLLRLDWSSINYRLDGGAGTDTINLGGTSNATLSGSSFSNLLSNAEFLDFSGTSGSVSLSLGGDDIQKILTGSSSTSNYAGVLDVKFDSSGDSLSLLSNGSYSYWSSSDVNATSGQIANGTNFSITNSTNSYVYVFDTNHTTLLATLYFHT